MHVQDGSTCWYTIHADQSSSIKGTACKKSTHMLFQAVQIVGMVEEVEAGSSRSTPSLCAPIVDFTHDDIGFHKGWSKPLSERKAPVNL